MIKASISKRGKKPNQVHTLFLKMNEEEANLIYSLFDCQTVLARGQALGLDFSTIREAVKKSGSLACRRADWRLAIKC